MTVPVPSPAQSGGAEGLQRYILLRDMQRRSSARPLTEDELAELEKVQPCIHCHGHHARACPRVKSISWHPNNVTASVEYWPDDQINWEHVVFEDQGSDEMSIGMDADRIKELELVLSTIRRGALAAQVRRLANRVDIGDAVDSLQLLVDTARNELISSVQDGAK